MPHKKITHGSFPGISARGLRIADITAAAGILIIAVLYVLDSLTASDFIEDEGFYLTVPYRLALGDSLVSDEWHLSQFSSIFMYLPVKLYVSVKGSADGLLLFSRLLFLPVHAAVSAWTYVKLRRFGAAGVISAFIYFLHTPISILAVSYNSLGMTFVTLTGLMLLEASERKSIPCYIAAGVFFACAAINNPFLLIIYALYCAALPIAAVFRQMRAQLPENNKKKKPDSDQIKPASPSVLEFLTGKRCFISVTAGAALVAAIAVMFYYATGGSIAELIRNLPMMLSDPEHTYTGENAKSFLGIKEVLTSLIEQYSLLFPAFCAVLATAAADVKKRLGLLWFISGTVLFTLFLYKSVFMFQTSVPTAEQFNHMLPIFLYGTLCFLLIKDKSELMGIFSFIYIPGLLYTLCLNISSNTELVAAGSGFAVADIACCIFICRLFAQYRSMCAGTRFTGKALRIILSSLLIIVLTVQTAYEFSAAFKGVCIIGKETVKAEEGPFAGITVTAGKQKELSVITDDLDDISLRAKDTDARIFITGNIPWAYLYTQLKPGTPSEWDTAKSYDRLAEYCKMHPDNMPDFIYVTAFSYPSYMFQLYRAKETADILSQYFICEKEQLKGGYCLTVTGMKQ